MDWWALNKKESAQNRSNFGEVGIEKVEGVWRDSKDVGNEEDMERVLWGMVECSYSSGQG